MIHGLILEEDFDPSDLFYYCFNLTTDIDADDNAIANRTNCTMANDTVNNNGTTNFHQQQRFVPMNSYLDYVLFYFFFLVSLTCNGLAVVIWDEYRLQPRDNRTVLHYLKKDYVTMSNRQVTLLSFIMMARILIHPFAYPLALGLYLLLVVFYCRVSIMLLYFFIIKLLLIRFPGFVESFPADRLRRILTVISYVVTLLFLVQLNLWIYLKGKRLEARTLLFFINDEEKYQEESVVPVIIIFIAVLVGITSLAACCETRINCRSVNLSFFKLILIMGTLIIVAILVCDYSNGPVLAIPISNILSPVSNVVIFTGMIIISLKRRKKVVAAANSEDAGGDNVKLDADDLNMDLVMSPNDTRVTMCRQIIERTEVIMRRRMVDPNMAKIREAPF